MESSDHKTPKTLSGRPSLLSSPAGNIADKHSQTRMLDSLERDGKMAGSASAGTRRSRKKYGFAALAVALVAGIGAFVAVGPFDDSSATVAAASAHVVPMTAAVRPASAAVVTAASAPTAASDAAARIEFAIASTPAAALSATVALVEPIRASQPLVNPPDNFVSGGVETAPVPRRAPVAAAISKKDKGHARDGNRARTHAETVAAAKPATTHADAKVPASHKPRKAEDDADADAELVAAIIARLDKRGAKPAPVGPATAVGSAATPANVQSQVHQCSSNTDLLEARQCRNRACEGHWGKVDACPATRAPKTSLSAETANGQPG